MQDGHLGTTAPTPGWKDNEQNAEGCYVSQNLHASAKATNKACCRGIGGDALGISILKNLLKQN
eukprot:CAMPEP_0206480572 /NCGR_PEP_ID=MMETSP0324_2-20121206/37457_1 /ASSEMBLY_ACC=CAM_ASM_000836 /TAXON_ID=2866 /ORGANISM="Crypthecodinium cohnii, Strain Seligo" /LENGTH=63 /DNA_ID=CAMNT_0053957551 /DNA_START=334 /DNA_END=525 /DNA_ORIENTATION=+